MPKKKESPTAIVSPTTAAKREKRIKRKRYNSDEYVLEEAQSPTAKTTPKASPSTTVALIKTPSNPVVPQMIVTTPTPVMTTPPSGKKKKNPKTSATKDKDSGTSSEEERWLDAIESGKLEEVDDELKKIKPKDPKFMTARQVKCKECSFSKN